MQKPFCSKNNGDKKEDANAALNPKSPHLEDNKDECLENR
jgi:hypothetical protein